MAQTKEVKVKDLKAGDELVRGGVIMKGPVFIGNYCGQEGRAQVSIKYECGVESARIWGWNTIVKIKSTDK